MARMGRPTDYCPETADEIISRLASGEQLRLICESAHLPSEVTIRNWIVCPGPDIPADFLNRYARARNVGLDAQAEGMTAISDDPTLDPNARRVMIDTRKWLFSKMRPDKYGDRLTLDGNVNITSIAETLRQREQRAGLAAAEDAQVIDVTPQPQRALPAPDVEVDTSASD